MNSTTNMIPVTDLIRKFGAITANLALYDSIILTKGGEPFAVLKALPEVKKRCLRNPPVRGKIWT